MKYSKSWTQALQEVRSHNQETEVPEGLSKEGAAEFMAAASAAKKAGKKKFKFGDKEYPVTIKTDIPTEGVKEQVGVRKVDFVDGITPNLDEKMFSGKGEFEVKYASSKKGPIKVSTFNTLEDAKKFLAQVKKEGMNGIISKGGKPVKEELDDKDEPTVQKVVKMLKKASKAHAGQADDLEKSMKEHHEKDANGEPIPHDDEEGLQEHCGECGAMDHVDEKMDGIKKFSGKQAKKDNEDRRAAQRKKLGILGPNEETINEADYELYHKTFSAAMQHAYAHAKKKGYIVDPDEIDNKVATGPKKPSSGKTNRYILGTNKKQKLHVQVANLDNKRFELNMYIEETEKENMNIEETIKQVVEGYHKKKKMEDASNDKSDDGEGMDKVDPKAVKKKFKDRKDKDLDNDGDTDSTDKYLHKRRKAISKAVDKEEQKEAYQEAEISKQTNDDTTAIGFASKGVKKKAKEPQEETLLDKVKGMMKEKKYKK